MRHDPQPSSGDEHRPLRQAGDHGLGGVDRIKSGLNAFVSYIDTRYPSKLNEAKGKLGQVAAWARIGVRGINVRRHVYGLESI
jgi:hypothetical protein